MDFIGICPFCEDILMEGNPLICLCEGELVHYTCLAQFGLTKELRITALKHILKTNPVFEELCLKLKTGHILTHTWRELIA